MSKIGMVSDTDRADRKLMLVSAENSGKLEVPDSKSLNKHGLSVGDVVVIGNTALETDGVRFMDCRKAEIRDLNPESLPSPGRYKPAGPKGSFHVSFEAKGRVIEIDPEFKTIQIAPRSVVSFRHWDFNCQGRYDEWSFWVDSRKTDCAEGDPITVKFDTSSDWTKRINSWVDFFPSFSPIDEMPLSGIEVQHPPGCNSYVS